MRDRQRKEGWEATRTNLDRVRANKWKKCESGFMPSDRPEMCLEIIKGKGRAGYFVSV